MRSLLILSLLILAGCVAVPAPTSDTRIRALIARPDFKLAAKAAPGWCSAAMHAIADAEAETDKLRLQISNEAAH